MYTVDLQDCIDKMDLECLTPDVDISKIKITQSDINRPALQLAGFFDYFDHHRVQIIGHVENTYMEKQGLEYSVEMMGRIMSYKVPCIVYCRDMAVPDAILEVADKAGVPIFHPSLALIWPSKVATDSTVRQLVVPTPITLPPFFFVSKIKSATS